MSWSAYYCVHGTSCLCTLSASAYMHWANPTASRSLFRNFFMDTCFCSFLIEIFSNLLCGATHIIAVGESSMHMCIDEWFPTASALCTLSLCRKKKTATVSSSYAQSKAQMNHTQRIFRAPHVLCYSTSLAEERKLRKRKKKRKKERKKERRRIILTFNHFRFTI